MSGVSNTQAEKAKHDVALICTHLLTGQSGGIKTGCLRVFVPIFIHIIREALFPLGALCKEAKHPPVISCACKLPQIKGLASLK